jgi:hypothetical protein
MGKFDKMQFTVIVHAVTERALLVSTDGDEEEAVWLPLSQIDYPPNVGKGDEAEISVPQWLADDKELC